MAEKWFCPKAGKDKSFIDVSNIDTDQDID